MPTPFFYHPRMLRYSFGSRHPLNPERLRRTIDILERIAPELKVVDPGLAEDSELLRIHSPDYIQAVRQLSVEPKSQFEYGFSSSDNPAFEGMDEASRAYTGGSVCAAQSIVEGEPLAFNIAGGLHHAMRSLAAGFCIFNDVALACVLLADHFERVLYVDIDVHHGDGVQQIALEHDRISTFSIHEHPESLWPGTGHVSEGDENTFNLPIPAGTSGDVWKEAFERALNLVVDHVQPSAIVLQMGTDPHLTDPLAHLEVSSQDWLGAVRAVKSLHTPIVATGGGGYNILNVPRMWVGAILTLLDRKLEDELLLVAPEEWGLHSFSDASPRRGQNALRVQDIVVDFGQRIGSLK
ncbi:MAG: hypothetical protein KF812_01255 [Fimbriimonadaceae bacterium]|nr:hypothetical protein [Fimbriimonadaceae bacterium]